MRKRPHAFRGWLFLRIFICDQFVVPSESMMPTLLPGDRILVNKLLAGSRIYSKLEFRQGVPPAFVPIPGLRGVHVNDVVVFNAPHGYDRDRIEFRINYVYAKRCVGTPGDSIAIRNGYFCNNRYKGDYRRCRRTGTAGCDAGFVVTAQCTARLPFR